MPKPSDYRAYLSLLIFKVSWALLVFWQEGFVWVALCLLAPGLLNQAQPGVVAARAIIIALAGIMIDQTLAFAGILNFATPVIPLWLGVLWLHFGVAVPSGFAFLGLLPLWGRMTLGAVAGPLGYWIGASRHSVALAEPLTPTLLLLACLWAVLLPAFLWFSVRSFQRTARGWPT